jgi:hypothetical protein
MGILAMDDCKSEEDSRRSMGALQEVLDLQRRIVEASAEMSWMVNRFQSADTAQRPALQEQLDELTATLLVYAEQMRSMLVRYRRGEE